MNKEMDINGLIAFLQVNTLFVQVDLVICGLFICKFVHLQLQIDHIFGTYPPIYSHY